MTAASRARRVAKAEALLTELLIPEIETQVLPTPVVEVWTDGACAPNPGPGGWGWIVDEEALPPRHGWGSDGTTTNQRMEMTAVIDALNTIPERPIMVVTDSRYVIDGATSWVKGWVKRGWRVGNGDPVKNRDLWEQIHEHVSRGDVSFRWVKGHAGHRLNEAADALAVRGRLALSQ